MNLDLYEQIGEVPSISLWGTEYYLKQQHCHESMKKISLDDPSIYGFVDEHQ